MKEMVDTWPSVDCDCGMKKRCAWEEDALSSMRNLLLKHGTELIRAHYYSIMNLPCM